MAEGAAETLPPDGELVAAYLAGDADAFDMLYGRYRKPLYAYLNRLTPGRPQVADDLYQQTWIKAIASLTGYEERSRFLPWLLRIAHNVAIDSFRRREPEPLAEDAVEALAAEDAAPSDRLRGAELREAVEQAVRKLPGEQREVVLMRLNGLSFKEIAGIQGTGINTALGRMHYAVQRLRQHLSGAGVTPASCGARSGQ